MAKKELEKEPDRTLIPGRPDFDRCDNTVITSKYTLWNFLPIALMEQFRRFANVYFLVVSVIMAIGWYAPSVYQSAISPWTTLGPLCIVLTISVSVQGYADLKRHRNDEETNNAKCVILRNAKDIDEEEGAERDEHVIGGRDVIVNMNKSYFFRTASSSVDPSGGGDPKPNPDLVRVGFQKVRRMDIRQGHIVLIKNREMIPADIVVIASSNDQGGAYIETSSIDGETNLKLRQSPQLPKSLVKAMRDGTPLTSIVEEPADQASIVQIESIESATKRIARLSAIGRPFGTPATEHPNYKQGGFGEEVSPAPPLSATPTRRASRFAGMVMDGVKQGIGAVRRASLHDSSSNEISDNRARAEMEKYVCVVQTEPPNALVHTFSGKLTFPPVDIDGGCFDVALGSENILLRGAVLRNTEWAIGLAVFTGDDTKLVRNSHKTASKFSQLDRLGNYIVIAILCIMFLSIVYLASSAVERHHTQIDQLWYIGLNTNTSEPWPYLPNLPPPPWSTSASSWIQFFMLFITLLTNFVPLSLYVTVEFVTICSLWFIYADLNMYDDTTDTRAVARSTIVTDLGRIQYIFSDKTGTLTQNVMRFKRCSVDGMAFGAPIEKARREGADDEDEVDGGIPFHPLRQLLVGRFRHPKGPGLEGLGEKTTNTAGLPEHGDLLTFNAEMFLRVLSLCHTVVVEKDIDKRDDIGDDRSVSSSKSGRSGGSSLAKIMFNRKRANSGSSAASTATPLASVDEKTGFSDHGNSRARLNTQSSYGPSAGTMKNVDGAPYGFAYQAESPDEGALVAAASNTFDFQVISRDTSGITLKVWSQSHFQNPTVVSGLKAGTVSLKRLAAESAGDVDDDALDSQTNEPALTFVEPREEKWAVLAVNKFDSDRKRMSILLRSPLSMGNLPILFCKGADSAMLEPEVSGDAWVLGESPERPGPVLPKPTGIQLSDRDVSNISTVSEDEDETEVDAWEMARMLGLQAHLGDFAKEGLRTLVLGMRVLTEDECEEWMAEYKDAATSMKNRSELLTQAAKNIERGLHIVGATAIEDKLQRGVPHTMSQLEKAGIKLWVLTGDKRETAVEIGYSTRVLTPKMHLTEVPDNGENYVRAQMAMEFIRLIKLGRLKEYQKAALDNVGTVSWKNVMSALAFKLGKFFRYLHRSVLACFLIMFRVFGMKPRSESLEELMDEKKEAESKILEVIERRRNARRRAERTISEWLQSDEGKAQSSRARKRNPNNDDDEVSLASDETPSVFNRASSAKTILSSLRISGKLSQTELRKMSIAHLTAQQADRDEELVVDEDLLSIESFFPGSGLLSRFDKRKRTLLERAFAVDSDVRKGRLHKHLTSQKLEAILEDTPSKLRDAGLSEGPRALVIEGVALKYLLGDPELEEILFSVASNCEAVIACRVSPKQKALLVNLVRRNVYPEPTTLAIGDGANDVGMIQEAHVGVGISGREGRQAVNASDFAIAQFRFLEELVLVHGRWNYFRMCTVVLFSFYKNALLALSLIIFAHKTVFSGTPLYDQWVIAGLNFVAGFPIVIFGLFDRCLGKEYSKENPEVYQATRENQLLTVRTLLRWAFLVAIHVGTLLLFTLPQQSGGGGITPAWNGLMRNKSRAVPGNGEGGDLKSVGSVTFSCLIYLLAYKVLFESKALIHGIWPAFTCRKDKGEGFTSRLAYTWIGVTYLSIGFYLFFVAMYSYVGRRGASSFSDYTYVAQHFLATRSLSWMLMAFVPFTCMIFDVCGKVFSNMFYPTQTQIHMELEAKAKMDKRKPLFSRGPNVVTEAV